MRQTDARLSSCICVTVNDKLYMYNKAEDITLVEGARDKTREWEGWEHFNNSLDAKEMFTLSIQLGIRLEFKKGSKETLSQELWSSMCNMADDRRQAMKPVGRHALTGKKLGRKKQDLSSRRYVLLKPSLNHATRKEILDDCPCSTRQAKKIWEFFVDEYLKTGSSTVTEGRMQDIVNDRAEELRTKQDPWRIFCYYRPELIDCQLIKLEK